MVRAVGRAGYVHGMCETMPGSPVVLWTQLTNDGTLQQRVVISYSRTLLAIIRSAHLSS